MMHMNFYVVDRGCAGTRVLVTILMVWIPAPTYGDPDIGVVYDEFIDESYRYSGSNWFDY